MNGKKEILENNILTKENRTKKELRGFVTGNRDHL